jgi:hypothetical protein
MAHRPAKRFDLFKRPGQQLSVFSVFSAKSYQGETLST